MSDLWDFIANDKFGKTRTILPTHTHTYTQTHTHHIHIYYTYITKLNQKTALTVKCFVYTDTRSDPKKLIKVVNVQMFANKKYIRF
jgi:hypothetical protein